MKPTLPLAFAVTFAAAGAHAQQSHPTGHTTATSGAHPTAAHGARPRRGHGDNAGASTVDENEAPSAPSPDSDTLIQAIQGAAVASNAEGARSIARLILRGVPPRVAAAGLDALGVMGRAEGADAVARFLQHRRPLLRRHAIAAAQAIHTPALVRALADVLGDDEPEARIEAATALGEVGGHDSVRLLLGAFERDLDNSQDATGARLVHEAAQSVAHIGSQDDVQRLLGFLRRAPFQTMADAMRIALGRRDLTEPFKVRLVEAIGDLATHDVKVFLESVITDAHGQDNAVTRAAHSAADRIAE